MHKLEKYLKQHKLTDAALGERVGLNQSSIWRIRRHNVVPTPATMARLISATNGFLKHSDFYPSSGTLPQRRKQS